MDPCRGSLTSNSHRDPVCVFMEHDSSTRAKTQSRNTHLGHLTLDHSDSSKQEGRAVSHEMVLGQQTPPVKEEREEEERRGRGKRREKGPFLDITYKNQFPP